MKAIMTATLTLMAVSMAYAGPISSGGTNQIVEICKNKDAKLTVQVVDSDHLEAELVDYSALNLTSVTTSTVYRVDNGYEGDNMKIFIEYVQGDAIATAVVLSNDPRMEPRVYPNLICAQSLK